MYAQVEKAKEKKSRSVVTSVSQNKGAGKQGFGYVDNRPKMKLHKILQREKSKVIQCMYMDGNGFVISDEQYDALDNLINAYDIDVGDIDKGSGAVMEEGQVKIGVALTNLIAYVNEQWIRKTWKFTWDNVLGQSSTGRFVGSFIDALDMAQKGKQCNNELASWMRNCLASFEHYDDE